MSHTLPELMRTCISQHKAYELLDKGADRIELLEALLREFYDNGYDRERCYAALGDRHE